ncbi:cytochrome b5-like Heme/Steroid binding domain-containing protein [Botrytis cinerea]
MNISSSDLATPKYFKPYSPSISPPCEKIIEQAERTNRYYGHENSGFLSKEAGFSPLQRIKAFPLSHAVWDQLATELPRLVKTQTVRETVTKMPLLDASAKSLPDIYLQRAATILGMTAHAFVRLEGSEPITLKYDSHSDILPPSLVTPWTIITKTLEKIHANRSHKDHIDPLIWTLTVANLGIPWLRGLVGTAGTAHPFFHIMDEFTGRSEYNTSIGKETTAVRAMYPIHWRQFLEAVREVSVAEYVTASKDRELVDIWKAFMSSYQGDDGLLGIHRRKALGFLAVSSRIGRNITNNGLGRKRRTEPWLEANQELEKTRLERKSLDTDEHFSSSDSRPKETGYWFSAQGNVYNASKFMQKHPGGDTVIACSSGQDITDSLNAVAHLTNPMIRNKLESYRIGTLQKPKFATSKAEDIYLAAVDLGQRAAEMENVHRRNFQLLDGKLTALDEPSILTPKKARHLLDARNRLRDEHVPVLAMLLDALLNAIANLTMEVDLSIIRAQTAGLVSPKRKIGTAVRFSSYEMAVDLLLKESDRLTDIKNLVAIVLATFEDVDFVYSEQSQFGSVMSNLSSVSSQLILLAGSDSRQQKSDSQAG